jgi:20S proteasome alpha/beta subunit
MTTVAWKDGILAADSRGTLAGWTVPGAERKLFRLKDGSVAAITGPLANGMQILRWIVGERTSKQPDGDARVIIVDAEGRIAVYEDGGFYYEEGLPFAAWGSGMPAALGAMHAGADAPEAVRIAGLVDPATGGAVCFIRPVTSEEMNSQASPQKIEDGLYAL